MIKTVVFNQDIDRSYLSDLKKSKRFIRQTRSQNFSRHILCNDDKPDLIRKREYCSDEDHQNSISPETNSIEVDTITDIDGLRQLAEKREKQRQTKKLDHSQIYEKNNNKNTHHFSPTPPKNPVPPGTRRRILPSRSKKIKVSSDF